MRGPGGLIHCETLGATCGQVGSHRAVLSWKQDGVMEAGWREIAAHLGTESKRVCVMWTEKEGGETKFHLVITSLGPWAEKIQKCPLNRGAVQAG